MKDTPIRIALTALTADYAEITLVQGSRKIAVMRLRLLESKALPKIINPSINDQTHAVSKVQNVSNDYGNGRV